MEKSQLFKRLYHMSMNEIFSFIKSYEDNSKSMYRLDAGARTRHIVGNIQIEEIWQELNDENKKYEIHLKMKFSPHALSSCWDFNDDMNLLEWQSVLPKYDDLEEQVKPSLFRDYLSLVSRVDIPDLDEFDIDQTCAFIDSVYDFQQIQNPPPSLDY